jgi:hypothetical protein
VILLAAILYGVWYLVTPTTGGTAKAECFVLIDRTSSVGQTAMKQHLTDMALSAIDGCAAESAHLQIGYFEQAGPKLVMAPDGFNLFAPEGRLASKQTRDKEQQVEAAKREVSEVMTVQPGNHHGSDILAAIREAADALDQAAAGSDVPKRLLVFTDGVQMSSAVTSESFSEATDVTTEVKKAKDLDLLPSFHGDEVYFFGVRSGEVGQGDQLTAAFEKKLEDFWAAIIDAGGGKRCRYVDTDTHVPGRCEGWS